MNKFRIKELKVEWISSERREKGGAGCCPVLDTDKPHISWILESDRPNTKQSMWQAVIQHTEESGQVTDWNSGCMDSEQSHDIVYDGKPLQSFTEYEISVMVQDNYQRSCAKRMHFETGNMEPDQWQICWMVPMQQKPVADSRWHQELEKEPDGSSGLTPCLYLRKEIYINKPVKKARAYLTARGIYHFLIDGEKISDVEFAPGFTAYEKYLEYQVYDVTECLDRGSHVIGIILADGWYLGHIGVAGMNCQYGTEKSVFAEIHLTYEDGLKEVITGKEGVVSNTGALMYSDLFVGEKYDAGAEKQGWALPGYSALGWQTVRTEEAAGTALRAAYGDPVRVVRTISAAQILHTPKGELVVDFGQVLAGRVSVIFRNTIPGQQIIMHHTEVLDKEGNYYHNIVGNYKDQRDVYICSGKEEERYIPHFTFHGFRYVKIEGYQCDTLAGDIRAQVICSDMEDTGNFVCSNKKLNQLMHNIRWSQYGNMLSLPTDCPQRERAGWTGDAQIFSETAAFNMDVSAFFGRWMRNVRKEQVQDGQIPVVVPYHKSYRPENLGIDGKDSAAGWGDVVILLPWNMYRAYGDISWLADNYDAMVKWLAYVRQEAENGLQERYKKADRRTLERQKYLWNTGFNFGDWLVPSLSTPSLDGSVDAVSCMERTKDEIATCYYAHSARLLSVIAGILGREEEAENYGHLFEVIRKAYAEEYITKDGLLRSDMQGTYVIALAFDMLPQEVRGRAAGRLKELIETNNGCLDTGFLSVNYLLDTLCDIGMPETAYQVLFQEKAPSWLYAVNRGATTVWEAWNAIDEEGMPSACSFNHYAFGCVGSFLYRRIGGLQIMEPGYQRFRVRPDFACGLDGAEVNYKSVYGEIVIAWKRVDAGYEVTIKVPVNTTAEVELPGIQETVGSGEYLYKVQGGSGI